MSISVNDVPALTKMLGPDLGKFKGMSGRIDTVLEEVDAKLASSLGRQQQRDRNAELSD